VAYTPYFMTGLIKHIRLQVAIMNDFKELTFTADDGYPLAGRLYKAEQAKGIIIVASATGVLQRFYNKFAKKSVANNFDVVTFDYRGIGGSSPSSLRGFEMDYLDWARKDLNAVIGELSKENRSIYLVAHSYGGHAIGLLENHHYVRAAYIFGTGAGWHGWMPKLEQFRVRFMWSVLAPIITCVKGYLGWSTFGMGEDLPLGVYRQWKHWCRFPHYFFDDPKYPKMQDSFDNIKMPIKAVNSVDDNWAMPASRDAFMSHYRNAQLQMIDLNPAHHGLKSIGHMGYFFGSACVLWDDVFTFFDSQ
jgi:predicted alpha/beta hydrolase